MLIIKNVFACVFSYFLYLNVILKFLNQKKINYYLSQLSVPLLPGLLDLPSLCHPYSVLPHISVCPVLVCSFLHFACKISTWNLSNDISHRKKRTKDPSLSISIPRIFFPLKKKENKTQKVLSLLGNLLLCRTFFCLLK